LTNSFIQDSSSFLGGGLYLGNPEYCLITNTSFTSNSAFNDSELLLSGLGGGLYYTCQSS